MNGNIRGFTLGTSDFARDPTVTFPRIVTDDAPADEPVDAAGRWLREAPQDDTS
ncbi:MAG: hypothetical protein R3F01_06985 [Lysobacteraceae bacterium]